MEDIKFRYKCESFDYLLGKKLISPNAKLSLNAGYLFLDTPIRKLK